MKSTFKITILSAVLIMILGTIYIGAQEQNKEKTENAATTEQSQIKTGGCCASLPGQEPGKMMGQEKGVKKGEQASCPMGKDCKGKECKGEGCPIHGANAKPAKPQTMCPVKGNAINKNISAEFKGQRVYFCTSGCQNEFKKTPEKYMKNMKDQGIEPEKIVKPQATCPVMGGKISREQYADYNGKRIYFCCAACPDKFKQEPEKYLKKLEEMGETPEELKQK